MLTAVPKCNFWLKIFYTMIDWVHNDGIFETKHCGIHQISLKLLWCKILLDFQNWQNSNREPRVYQCKHFDYKADGVCVAANCHQQGRRAGCIMISQVLSWQCSSLPSLSFHSLSAFCGSSWKAVKDSGPNFMKLTDLRSDGVLIVFTIPYKKSNTFPHYHSSLSSAFISFSTSGLVSAGLTFFIQ